MLSRLIINNVALIEKLELEFCGGLNILSGETGAGKSIIVDSLMLLLGGKYDKTILRFGTESGFVEGVFEDNDKIYDVLGECGFEQEDILIVNRKFLLSGKNEIRVNGRVCTLSMLKTIMSKLVDIYGQNEYQSLVNKSEHLKIVNYFLRGELQEKTEELSKIYASILAINKQLRSLGESGERARNADIIRFQLQEIEKANAYDGEEEELKERRNIIASSEKIATAFTTASAALSCGDESSVGAFIAVALDAIGSVSSLSGSFSALYEQLKAVSVELDDISSTCESQLSEINFDFNEVEKLEQRLDTLRTLRRKYGDFVSMEKFVNDNQNYLDTLDNAEYLFEKYTKEKTVKLKEFYALAEQISVLRKKGSEKLSSAIIAELADLGMAGADFRIEFNEFPQLSEIEKNMSSDGLDKVEFYFSANKGQPLKPLTKIISGGELSRFMLALKTVSSRTDDISTMIFDEIDTGISGKIGQEVAKKLAIISHEHQVLCVTHLPQIASMADNHYFISKSTINDKTITNVEKLDHAMEVEEISRLSGAQDISKQATENAEQMKKWSDDFKSQIKS